MALSQEDSSQHSVLSPDDAFGKVFGKEHPGRVRGLGIGACPTSVFGTSSQRFGGIHFSSTSSTHPASREEVDTLKSKLSQAKDKLKTTEDKLQKNEDKLQKNEEELAQTKEQMRTIMEILKEMGARLPPSVANKTTTVEQVHFNSNLLHIINLVIMPFNCELI